MLIIDGHEDIAWNAVCFGRDYTQSAYVTRRREAGTRIPEQTGSCMLGRPEWLMGHVGVIFATIFVSPARSALGAWDSEVYTTPAEAYDRAMRQMEYYHHLVDDCETFMLVETRADLEQVLESWAPGKSLGDRRIGLVLLMEGADPIREPEQVAEWYEQGLRIVGPAWAATQYAGGNREPGPLTDRGEHLLAQMADLNMVLDLSHMAEMAYYQALDRYPGPLIASHANARRFTPTMRGLSDDMILRLADREGVIGAVAYNPFLKPGHVKGDPRDRVSIHDLADAIDHICQLTGTSRHAALGSDLDGGYGLENAPAEVDTVSDMQRLEVVLESRGYSTAQITEIFSENWLRVLRSTLPEGT